MAGMALDPINALAGWLTQQFGDSVVAGVRTFALGDAQQRAFRLVVSHAIDRVVSKVGDDRQDFLRAVLTEHHEGLEAMRGHRDLRHAVSALVASLDDPEDPQQVAPSGLAEDLTAEINIGILENARSGGPLAPLVLEARFAELFALNERLHTTLDTMCKRLEEACLQAEKPMINAFSGAWRSLRNAYLDPHAAWPSTLAEAFTGREWLVREIDDFVTAHDRGYFIVQADAGAGKTAFALRFSSSRGLPIHFTGYSGDARRTGPAVRNLVAQLIASRNLHEFAPGGYLPADADWASLLRQALDAAARQRDAEEPGTPILLVVDGLDESVDHDPDQLPFGLPDELPPGVYVIATVRNGCLPHQPAPPTTVCHWGDRMSQQEADMRTFITETVHLHLIDKIVADGMTPNDFIRVLLDRCGDVWLYLHHILQELMVGTSRPSDVPSLPRRLNDYYHNTVERYLRDDADAAWRLPLLATLAVASEPLDVTALTRLAGLEDQRQVRRFLTGPLRPFCAVSSDGRWKLKHMSFNAYLADGPDPDAAISSDARHQREDLASEASAAQRRIGEHYLSAWGGLDANLPALAADPALAQRDGGYPLRTLAGHLVAAHREHDLHRLLACGPGENNIWYEAHEAAGDAAGFLNDVAIARRVLVDGPDTIGARARYALTEAAVATAFTTITPVLLEELVIRKRWTVARALNAIERITEADQQAEALLRIVPHIPDELVPSAWTLALSLRQRERLSAAAVALIDRLPANLLDSVVRIVATHARESRARTAAAKLTRLLPEDRLRNYPFSQIPDMQYNDKMLLMDLPRADATTADAALSRLTRESNEFLRCQDLAEIVPYLPPSACETALAVLAQLPARYRSDALIALATWAPAERIVDVLTLAAEVEWESTPPEALQQPWIELMRAVSPRLTTLEQESAAVAVCLALGIDHCAEALETLAPSLSAETARHALRDVEAAHDFSYAPVPRMIMVGAILRRLPASEARAEAAQYASEEFALSEEPESGIAEQLAPIAPYLHPDTVRMTARRICHNIRLFTHFAIQFKASLARLAPLIGHDRALLEDALATTTDASSWQPANRLMVLEVLAPHLEDDALDEALTRLLPGPVEEECFTAVAALNVTLPGDSDQHRTARGALDEISRIGNNRQQVRALGTLAPGLPPDLAVTALEAVAAMTRKVLWPSVLDTLDALAPQLPVSALPRALDVLMDTPEFDGGEVKYVIRLVRRLGNEDPTDALRHYLREPRGPQSLPKESWFWAFAPHLSPSLARHALPAARDQPDYARRVSLAALCPRLPQDLRLQVALEALEVLDVRPESKGVKLAVLARLAEAVNHDDVTAACHQAAVDLDRFVPESWDDSEQACADFLAHLPSELVGIVLDVASRRQYLVDRCDLVTPLIKHLSQETMAGLVADVEVAKEGMGVDERSRVRTLVALAAATHDVTDRDRIISGVLDRVERSYGYHSWYVYGPALLDLIPFCPPHLRARSVAAALHRCLNSKDGDEPRKLISLLNGDDLDAALDLSRAINDPQKKIVAITAVLRRAGELARFEHVLSDVDIPGVWPSTTTRAELFSLVGASAWWIRGRGGSNAAAATVDAVFDVARWWR